MISTKSDDRAKLRLFGLTACGTSAQTTAFPPLNLTVVQDNENLMFIDFSVRRNIAQQFFLNSGAYINSIQLSFSIASPIGVPCPFRYSIVPQLTLSVGVFNDHTGRTRTYQSGDAQSPANVALPNGNPLSH